MRNFFAPKKKFHSVGFKKHLKQKFFFPGDGDVYGGSKHIYGRYAVV
jgi:hypothetical protein